MAWAKTRAEREREGKRAREDYKKRNEKKGRNKRGRTRWEEDMCDFISDPYSNGYSITCACWSRYAFADERQVLVVGVGVGEGQLTRVRDLVRVCVSACGESVHVLSLYAN